MGSSIANSMLLGQGTVYSIWIHTSLHYSYSHWWIYRILSHQAKSNFKILFKFHCSTFILLYRLIILFFLFKKTAALTAFLNHCKMKVLCLMNLSNVCGFLSKLAITVTNKVGSLVYRNIWRQKKNPSYANRHVAWKFFPLLVCQLRFTV